MGVSEVFIPITFFLTIGGIWGLLALTRHKERMTMIEKGLKSEDIKAMYERGTIRISPLSSLKWGMVFVAIGLAVLLGMFFRQNYYVDDGIYPALISLLGGLGLVAFYFIANKRTRT
ncbi:MAG: DUF6249 domain-containing protein [Bacteroidota bacterium]